MEQWHEAEWDNWLHYAPEWPYQHHELDIALFVGPRETFDIEYQLADFHAYDTAYLHAEFLAGYPIEGLDTIFLVPPPVAATLRGQGFLIVKPLDGEITIKALDGGFTIKSPGGTVLIPSRGEIEL